MLAVGLLALLATFGETVAGAVSIWWNISTYNHCFLILPISLFLVWDRRQRTAALTPQPSYWGLWVMLAFGLMWLAANVTDIAEAEQFALVGMIQGFILGTLGPTIFRTNLLAILYLWLLVPSGQFALPPMQSIAALGTEWQLQLAGIPIFRDGLIIQVPTGLYRIAPGCAGLNFVLTAIAVAPLYGYLFYDGLRKRLIAVAVMVLVALIANAIRIFAIIALAEATDRQIDIVDDHLLYGWGFFSLILLLMGMLGMRWTDATDTMQTSRNHQRHEASPVFQLGSLVFVASLSLLIVVSAASFASIATGRPTGEGKAIVVLPDTIGPWRTVETDTDWRPDFAGAHGQYYRRYEAETCCVDLFVAYYWRQSDGRELVTNSNGIANNGNWIIESRSGTSLRVGETSLQVIEAELTQKARRRLVWYWYWVDGRFTTSELAAKILQAKSVLLWGEKRSAIVALSVEQDIPPNAISETVTHFLGARPDFEQILASGQWNSLEPSQSD